MIKRLAVRLAEVKAKKVCDTPDQVQAKALVKKLAATVAEMGARQLAAHCTMKRPRHWLTQHLTRHKR